MDDVRTLMLEKAKDKLLEDLQVDVILDDLVDKGVLDKNQRDLLNKVPVDNIKTRYLIDIIKDKDNSAYDIFCDVLRKDYSWLAAELMLFTENGENKNVAEFNNRVYYDALTRANIPRPPPHYVKRVNKANEIVSQLKKLKRGEYVTLHGMTCIGKTCLAMEVVQDPDLMKNYLNNNVFWIDPGVKPTENDLILSLMKLHQIITFKTKPSTNNRQSTSSVGTLDLVRNQLKEEFTKDSVRETLIVLDDVHSKDVINAFDLGCKVLVTTRDKSIVPKSGSYFFELKEGFTKNETRQFFAKCIGVTVDELTPKAGFIDTIYKLSKGGPMLVALIGSLLEEHREDAIISDERWKGYISKLQNKESWNLGDECFSMCLDNLNPELKMRYKHLAVFVEDVNIMPLTLQIIWSLDKYDMEDVMTSLKNKSLLVSSYNQQLKTYVYGIHDLLLNYLKNLLTPYELTQLHCNLIKKYKEHCNNQFANLPNDNYIFSYIGHHLYEAKMFDDFPNVYFDLNFIGAKLKAVGPADLLVDFKRYHEYITKHDDEELVYKLKEFEQFIQEKGQEIRKYSKLDIIQCALNEPKTSCVYKQAFDLAKRNHDRLYFELQYEQRTVFKQSTLDIEKSVIRTACFFIESANRFWVLVGNENGAISLWDHDYKSCTVTFDGHTKAIKSLLVHPTEHNVFVSISLDGTAKLWVAETITQNGFHERTPSPRVRQENWANLYDNNDARPDTSRATFHAPSAITCAAFSQDGSQLLTGCQNGEVIIWNTFSGEELVRGEDVLTKSITSCQLSGDGAFYFYSWEKKIFICSKLSGKQLGSIVASKMTQNLEDESKAGVISLHTIPNQFDKLLSISSDRISIWTMKYTQKNDDILLDSIDETPLSVANGASYVCGTVTLDGMVNYAIACDSANKIRIWNLDSLLLVQERVETCGKIISLDTYTSDTDDDYIILLITTSETVKLWSLRNPADLTDSAPRGHKLTSLYSAHYDSQNNVKIACVDHKNNVFIYEGLNEATKLPKVKSSVRAINFYNDKVAIGYEDGKVTEFDSHQFGNGTIPPPIMYMPNEDIKYLEYMNDTTLVAAGGKGSFMLRINQGNQKVIDGSLMPKDHQQVIIKCYMYRDSKRFISVTQDYRVKCYKFSMDFKSCELETVLISSSDGKSRVTMAALSQFQDKMALADENGQFQIFTLSENIHGFLEAVYSQGSTLEKLKSCCFSPDGSILALGQVNGKIQLWSTEHKTILQTLSLHHSQVHNLHFAPSSLSMIMVSVGDQIGWWDVSYIKQKFEINRNRRGSGRFSASKSLQNFTGIKITNEKYVNKIWDEKLKHRELLASFKLRGTYATHVEISDDFTSFSLVDDQGLIYIMNVLNET